MLLSMTSAAAFAVSVFSIAVVAQRSMISDGTLDDNLPVVDLGYELYQAVAHNRTGGYYNFSNIRFAAPPTGANRFSLPQSPEPNRTAVQKGDVGRWCPQATPAWQNISYQFASQYLAGTREFNDSSFNATSGPSASRLNPPITEDCLFLDVIVPEKVFGKAGKGFGAPVLVWIYGGGYVSGAKDQQGNPAGLIARSENNHSNGVVYVALNYRLGAFGWLSGPTFQENATSNLGLHDQRFALEWVQGNIDKFGGDPQRVTVLGESAGAGSIMHQITAWGGNRGPAPFRQAILQSPAFFPMLSPGAQESTFQTFLELLNVSTIDEARFLPYEDISEANTKQIVASPYDDFTYGPTVDGDIAPALPGQLLARGQFDRSLRIMTGHNKNEGLLFTYPFIRNEADFAAQIMNLIPTVRSKPAVIEYIVQELYPPVFDGSQAQNYTDQLSRAAALISEVVFTCNTFYLDKAYDNRTYSYYFTVPPATHGSDIQYTFYNGDPISPETVLSAVVAKALQDYIVTFAQFGAPNEIGVPYFTQYGANMTVQTIGIGHSTDGIKPVQDPAANERCNWWQKVLYA